MVFKKGHQPANKKVVKEIDTSKVEAEEDILAQIEQADMAEVDKMCSEDEYIKEKVAKSTGLNIIRVMDKATRQVIKIDADIEIDYKSKYLHCSGKEFTTNHTF